MKKILIPLFVAALFLVSCEDKKAYTVNGHVGGSEYDNTQVYLHDISEEVKRDPSQTPNVLDTATVVNGSFTFKGDALNPSLKMVVFEKKQGERAPKSILFLAEPGTIDVSLDSTVTTIKGTAKNDAYQVFIGKMRATQDKKRDLYKEYQANAGKDKDLEAAIDKQYDEVEAQEQETIFDYIHSNLDNPIGIYLFQRNGSMLKPDKIKTLLSALPADKKGYESVSRLDSYVKALDNTAEGKIFTDIKAKNPQDKDIALSEYAGKGKIVLVDFWASWCGPCRREMPELVKMYAKYKNKGFEIVGVSLDDDKEAWLEGLNSMKMTWPQISDLKGWNAQGAQDYGVRSIPHTLLLDKEGKIIARGLYGEELIKKVDELMK